MRAIYTTMLPICRDKKMKIMMMTMTTMMMAEIMMRKITTMKKTIKTKTVKEKRIEGFNKIMKLMKKVQKQIFIQKWSELLIWIEEITKMKKMRKRKVHITKK